MTTAEQKNQKLRALREIVNLIDIRTEQAHELALQCHQVSRQLDRDFLALGESTSASNFYYGIAKAKLDAIGEILKNLEGALNHIIIDVRSQKDGLG